VASIPQRPKKRLSKAQRRRLKVRQARKARDARRQLRHLHDQLPRHARQLLDTLAPAFTRPAFLRFVVLVLGAILTLGSRTVANLLRTLGDLAPGHFSSFHRLLSRCRWQSRRLVRALVATLLRRFLPDGPIPLVGDDTVAEHPGPKVYGKGCHRDPVRSTHSFTTYRWGHKWVVLALLVRFPFARRLWALPVLVALYLTEEANTKQRRRHQTPSPLLRQQVCALLHWFPDRRFVLAADGNYATHELARRAARFPGRLTFVSKFYPKANPYAPAPRYAGHGRPPEKGPELPAPAAVVANAGKRQRLNVGWYGGGRRDVAVVTGTGLWYRSGEGVVPVRWVFVQDLTGTHRDEYFFTTDQGLSPTAIIETYTGRWNIETTFQELRSYAGLETTRGWCRNTVLRAEPCLFGLYTVVALLYAALPARDARVRGVEWPRKRDVTFSDAITAVRRWLWQQWVFAIPGYSEDFQKLPAGFRSWLLSGLAPAS
jgi:DDE superfamily endonuclease